MLLHHLRLVNIGPFAGDYTIDFDSLTADGLFLLDGPTGSGKSSIIDSIVFALYGTVAGKDGDNTRIRSTHSDPKQPSEIELVFSINNRYFLVRRSPKWDRPKKHGGTTEQNAQATLFELSEAQFQSRDWDSATAIETGPRQVNPTITQIIGLNRKQFGQTVVLPQGEFAQFLELKPDDRATLLETLFGTENYRRLAEKLAASARDAQSKQDKAKQVFTGAVESWFGIAAVNDQVAELRKLHESIVDPDDRGALPQIAEITQQLAKTAQREQQKHREQDNTAQAARRRHEKEEELAAALAERTELLAQKQLLDEQEAEVAQARARVGVHRQVAPAVQRMVEAKATFTRAVSAVTVAQQLADSSDLPETGHLITALSEFNGLAPLDTAGVASYLAAIQSVRSAGQDWASELREERGALNTLRELEENIPERERALVTQQDELADLVAKQKQTLADSDVLPKEIAEQNNKLTAARKQADQKQLYEQQLHGIVELQEVARKISAAQPELAQVKVWHQQASDALAAAIAQHAAVAKRWRSNIAADFADELATGEPCPVCGAVEHPSPAKSAGERATLAEVDAAQELVTAQRKEVGNAEKELEALSSKIKVWEEQLEGKTAKELTQEEKSVTEKLAAAESAAQQITELAKRLTALEEKRDNVGAKLAELAKQISSHEAAIKRDEKAIAADRQKLDSSRREFASVAARVARLNAQLTSAEKLVKEFELALQELQSTAALESSAHDELAKTKLSAADAHAAYLPEAELETLTEQISRYDTALTKVTSQLESPRLAKLSGDETVDVAATQAALAQAEIAAREAQDIATLAESSAADAQRLAEKVLAAHKQWAAIAAENGPLVRLANLAQARQSAGEKIPLQMWVLIKRFEIIVDRANEYLANFSAGRYELIRITSGERREQKLGLGLRIVDYKGSPDGEVERSVRTLSGGETFFTSLSLALALAEVVQEENGGIQIDTLLIDEGFGTLDADTRDTVMRTLFTLTRSGRKVGLISHVEEMKKLIANRVTITPQENGGSTLKVIA